MYATLSYDVTAGTEPVEDLRTAIFDVFKDRETCDLLSDTLICRVANTSDYLAVVRALKKVGTAFPDQFQYVFTLHAKGAPLRSNGTFPASKADDIIG